MSRLIRADWLRFRGRRDFWIIAIGVLVISGLSFLAGYRADAADPEWPSEAQVRQEARDYMFFEGSPEEIEAQIEQYVVDMRASNEQSIAEWEAQQRINLQKYDVPQAPFTLLGSGLAPLLALILVASLAVGDEFRHGTIRTSFLAAGHRRRFLAARLVSLSVLVIGLHLALVLLGFVLAIVLRVVGADVTPTVTPISAAAAIAWFGGLVLVATVLVSLATFLALLLRSGALPLLILLIGGLIELFLVNLPIFARGEPLAAVPHGLLTTSLQLLGARLGADTHAIALVVGEMPERAVVLPLVVLAGVVLAWGIVFVLAADRRIRRMDIVE